MAVICPDTWTLFYCGNYVLWLKLLCRAIRPLWLWKLEFNLNSGCLCGRNSCIEYSSVVEYVFCLSRLLTFDCKLAIRISQWNKQTTKYFLKKGFFGLHQFMVSQLWNAGIFVSTCFLYLSCPLYIEFKHFKKCNQTSLNTVCCIKQQENLELYVCAEGLLPMV